MDTIKHLVQVYSVWVAAFMIGANICIWANAREGILPEWLRTIIILAAIIGFFVAGLTFGS